MAVLVNNISKARGTNLSAAGPESDSELGLLVDVVSEIPLGSRSFLGLDPWLQFSGLGEPVQVSCCEKSVHVTLIKSIMCPAFGRMPKHGRREDKHMFAYVHGLY